MRAEFNKTSKREGEINYIFNCGTLVEILMEFLAHIVSILFLIIVVVLVALFIGCVPAECD